MTATSTDNKTTTTNNCCKTNNNRTTSINIKQSQQPLKFAHTACLDASSNVDADSFCTSKQELQEPSPPTTKNSPTADTIIKSTAASWRAPAISFFRVGGDQLNLGGCTNTLTHRTLQAVAVGVGRKWQTENRCTHKMHALRTKFAHPFASTKQRQFLTLIQV